MVEEWNYMKELWTDKKKRYLILQSSLAFLLIAHAYRWVNTMYSHDSLLIIQSDVRWKISLGRIFNPLCVWLRGKIVAPMNVALFSCVFLILSAALIIGILNLKKNTSIVLCCGFLTTFETFVFINAVFLLSLDQDMIALMFSVLAACFFMGRKSNLLYAAGIVSLTIMLGLFQSYVEVTIMLICLVLLREALEGGDPKQLFFKGLRSVGLLILGGILYYLCLKAVLKYTGIAPADTYNGLVKMKTLTFRKVLFLAKDAWIFTLRYLFFDPQISHRLISMWIYRILGLISLFSIGWIAFKKRLGIRSVVLIVFLLLIMPLGGNCVYVLSLGLKHGLMTYSFVFFSILAVMVFDMLESDRGMIRYIRCSIPMLCAVLLLNHVLFANQWYTRNDLFSQAGRSFMTRLVADMEDIEGYEVGKTPVLILGHIDDNPAVSPNKNFKIADDLFAGSGHSMVLSYYQTFSHYFRYILEYPVNIVPLSEVAGYLEVPQIKAMPVYPALGSVQLIDGVMVIRLSDDLRPEEFRW